MASMEPELGYSAHAGRLRGARRGVQGRRRSGDGLQAPGANLNPNLTLGLDLILWCMRCVPRLLKPAICQVLVV